MGCFTEGPRRQTDVAECAKITWEIFDTFDDVF